jgi:hypothetical protein
MPTITSNIRTIARDLALLTEDHLYAVEIKVCGGSSRVSKVDVEDFAPPTEILEVWKNLGSKTKPPQLKLFEALDRSIKELVEARRRIYDGLTVHLGIERVVGGSKLVEFQLAFEQLQHQSTERLREVLSEHAYAKSQWLENEIRPLLEAGRFNGIEVRDRLHQYALRFPSYDKIEAKFGVQLKFNPTSSFQDLLQRDIEWQQQLAERAQAEANWMRAQAEQQQVVSEAQAAERALQLQEQRLRSAIEEKVSEVRTQVLEVLKRNLERVISCGWNSGAMPASMQQQLESLAQSARVLTQADASLEAVVDRVQAVQQAGRHGEADDLQEQVEVLLAELNQRLQVPGVERWVVAGEHLDRAFFAEF